MPDENPDACSGSILTRTVFDGFCGACIHAGAAFDAFINMRGVGFTVYEFENVGRADIDALPVCIAFVFIYFDRQGCTLTLVFFYCHEIFSCSVCVFIQV